MRGNDRNEAKVARGAQTLRRIALMGSIASVAILGCACTSSTSPSTGPSSAGRSATSTADTASRSASTATGNIPACPNPEGGACVGKLTANKPYTTQIFGPSLTYRVPAAGWFNYEDTPGNFLLVPPGNGLPGVNAGTADFIGVYTAVAPARIIKRKECVTERVSGAGASPQVMAGWFRSQADLDASTPVPVRVGRLHGVSVDLRTKPGAKLPYCTVGRQRILLAGLFSGIAPSSLDHAVIPGMTMRLFLLSWKGNVLAIELDDIDKAPGGLARLTTVARSLEFGS